MLRSIKRFDRRDNSLASLDPHTIRRVLLISSTALGDAVMSSAAFIPLRQRFPHARVAALFHRNTLALFRQCRELDEILPYQSGTFGFLKALLAVRRVEPELVIILHGNEPQATPLAYLSGARWIVKLPNARNPFRFLLSNREPVVTREELGHGLTQRLRTAEVVGAVTTDARMALPDDAASVAAVDAWLEQAGLMGKTLIGLQCGASARSRMWPGEKFVALGRLLQQANPQLGIVLTGAPTEQDYLDGIAAAIGDRVAVSAGRVPLEQLPALVRRLRVLVSGDTGTMHVAFAVGTPTVCLFAVSDPATSGPPYDANRHAVIFRPCVGPKISTKAGDDSCIGRIEVDEVAAAIRRQLQQ